MNKSVLIEEAKEGRKLSYSPYSHFAVGAAVLSKDGRIFKGGNVENSSYPLSLCAERNAIANAMMNGVKPGEMIEMAIIADTDDVCAPCGACRQVISELLDENAIIYLCNLKGDVKETNVKELLPFAFGKKDLN